MTFEQAIKEVDNALDQVYYMDTVNELYKIMYGLQEEYAPTIEMTKKERVNLLNAKNSGKSFYELWGHYKLNSHNSLGNYSEEQLMQAWLHLESIKVINEEQV